MHNFATLSNQIPFLLDLPHLEHMAYQFLFEQKQGLFEYKVFVLQILRNSRH